MSLKVKANRRVVVTGLGVVSPIGIGLSEFWNNLIQGRSGIREITRFDASDFPSRIASAKLISIPWNTWIDVKPVKWTGSAKWL